MSESWFTPFNDRLPVQHWHELANEELRAWLSRHRGDELVRVDEVLMRLGRKVSA